MRLREWFRPMTETSSWVGRATALLLPVLLMGVAADFWGRPCLAQGASKPAGVQVPVPFVSEADKSDAAGPHLSAEILTDTQGVNFAPYITHLLQTASERWHGELAKEPGAAPDGVRQTAIRIGIGADGSLLAMHLDTATHVLAVDRAAWGAITQTGRFDPLPKEFTGRMLEMRLLFSAPKDEAK